MANILPPPPHPGRTSVYTGPNPLPQTDAVFSVPAGVYLLLSTITCICFRAAGAARIGFRIIRNADTLVSTVCAANMGAGTWNLSAMAGAGLQLAVHTIAVQLNLPANLTLHPDDTITTVTAGMGVGDAYQPITVCGYAATRFEN